MSSQGFTDGDNTLLCAWDASLQHEEVISHDAIVREAPHRGNSFLRGIVLGRSVVFINTGADTIDFFVQFGSVVITIYEKSPLIALSQQMRLHSTYVDLHGRPKT